MHRYSRATLTAATLIAMTLTLAGCQSSAHSGGSSSGGIANGTTGGAAAAGGAANGGAAAAGGVVVPTEINLCHVDFSPSAAGPNNALGMTWGAGQITFDVSMDCTKPASRGTLTYAVFYTGTSNPQTDISPAKPYSLAGIAKQHFPYTVPCKAGTYLFEYQWEATVSGATDNKQDANTGTGILLTSANCK